MPGMERRTDKSLSLFSGNIRADRERSRASPVKDSLLLWGLSPAEPSSELLQTPMGLFRGTATR